MKHGFLLIILMHTLSSPAQQVLSLYNGAIPNSIGSENKESSEIKDSILMVSNVSQPTLTTYFPENAKSPTEAVIVCPGGGYGMVAAGHEGEDVARKLNELGIVAFVLKYRLPNKEWMINPEIGPLQDAQRAIQLVRENATRWKIRKDRIGILGFSAGGHLASTAATHFNKSYIPNRKRTSLRPDFLVLIYPVISFSDSIGHLGSRDNLLGKNATPEKVREYSNELNVTKNTPPTFLAHAKDDPVNYKNTTVFADALQAKGILTEVLLFESGGHGFGLINKSSNIQWAERMAQWLKKLDD